MDDAWCMAKVKCAVCNYEHISVYPEAIEDEDNQECPNCGMMACEIIEAE